MEAFGGKGCLAGGGGGGRACEATETGGVAAVDGGLGVGAAGATVVSTVGGLVDVSFVVAAELSAFAPVVAPLVLNPVGCPTSSPPLIPINFLLFFTLSNFSLPFPSSLPPHPVTLPQPSQLLLTLPLSIHTVPLIPGRIVALHDAQEDI